VEVEIIPALSARSADVSRSEGTGRTEDASRPMVLPDYSGVNLTELLPAPDGAASVSDFPMHGMLRETVAGIVMNAGGEIVHVVDDDHAKPEWNGFKYFVVKKGQEGTRAPF
jgi:hypothetical protein